MAWRRQLRPGSFRGARFEVDISEVAAGRRTARHEYPQRDLPFLEDLGRRAREYQIEAFVIGSGYMAARDALLAAAEEEGPGTLVHPYLGTLSVVCTGCRLRESTAEGGMATFAFTFVEAGERSFPETVTDTATAIEEAAAAARAATIESFVRDYLPQGAGFLAADSLALVEGALDTVERLSRQLRGGGAGLAAFGRSLALSLLERAVLSVVPRQLAGRLLELVELLPGVAGEPRRLLRAQRALGGYGLAVAPAVRAHPGAADPLPEALRPAPMPATATPDRAQQQRNREAFVRVMRRAGAIAAARTAALVPLESYDEAVRLRERLGEQLEAAILDAADAGDDEAWQGLQRLQRAVVRDITRRGGSLARVYSWRPAATEPALVAAHRLHGDALRDAEIVARNRIRHPGFLPGGEPLEVLGDG